VTTTGDEPDTPDEPSSPRPIGELPDAVRQRVVEWAADALSAALASDNWRSSGVFVLGWDVCVVIRQSPAPRRSKPEPGRSGIWLDPAGQNENVA